MDIQDGQGGSFSWTRAVGWQRDFDRFSGRKGKKAPNRPTLMRLLTFDLHDFHSTFSLRFSTSCLFVTAQFCTLKTESEIVFPDG
jgi:hypothetical protein